jgi:hypothetical protein
VPHDHAHRSHHDATTHIVVLVDGLDRIVDVVLVDGLDRIVDVVLVDGRLTPTRPARSGQSRA